jgi:hypothetical protein
MVTISKHPPLCSLSADRCGKPTYWRDVGKADDVGEGTGMRTQRPAGIMAQASWDRRAEITSGRTISQQGLAATCKDHRVEVGDTKSWKRVVVWRMSP